MICGNAALLYESPDESNGRKLKFSRSMMDRFHRDSSLDRAMHLREAQRRRAGYLADLKKRDQHQQRGRRYSTNVDSADNASDHSDASLLDIVEVSAGVNQHREVFDGSSRAAATGSQSTPKFSGPQMRSPHPTRPSTTPATGRAKSPSRLGGGSCPKENRQAATERAVRVYSAGAGIANGGRRHRSPVTPLPAWDDRSPSPSAAEQQRRRLSPREHGRHPVPWPLDDAGVGKAGKACAEVPCHGGTAAGASNGSSDCRRRPVRPSTGGRPSKRFSRPVSAFAGRWDGDESFPDKPHGNLFSSDGCELDREDGSPVDDKPSSAPKGRACSPPSGGLRRARTAEETPAIQRARQAELQRLAVEKKELQAQLAEVKQLMRASKVRAKATSGELFGAATGGSPRKPRGRTLVKRSRQARGRKKEEQRRGSAAPSTEDAARVPCDLEKACPRGKGEEERTEESRERSGAGDVRGGCDYALSAGGAGKEDNHSRRRRKRRKRKRSGDRGRSQSRRRQPQVLGIRSAIPEKNAGRRRTQEHSATTLVAFNTCVSVNRPASVDWVQGVSSPRGNNIACAGGGDTGTRRLCRPKSASRRSRSAPRASMKITVADPIARGDRDMIDGLVARGENDSTRRGRTARPASNRPRSRASKSSDRFAAAKGRDRRQDGGERRVYFAQFSAGGNRPSANARIVPGEHGTSARTKPIEQTRTRTTTSTSVEDAEKGYEDDFEVISARDSYESDFEPWEGSESLHGPSEGKQRLYHDSSRRSRARGSGIGREDNRTWSDREISTAIGSCGGGGAGPAADSFLRDGEKWSDGQQQGLNHAVVDGGAASWAEWNQPDDGSGGFAPSGGWDTREREVAAAHAGSRKGNRGFDHLWVDGCDNVLGTRAEEETDGMAGARDAGEDQRRKLDGYSRISPSYEEYSTDTAGGPPSLARPPRLVDDGRGKWSLGANVGEEERVSTASMSDGGASLYDVLLSSRDDSYSDETWSLESHDRRNDTAKFTSAVLGLTAAARATRWKAKRRYSAVAGSSSDGSSLYDVTSQPSDNDKVSTGNKPVALDGSGKPVRPVVAAEGEISVERASDTRPIPSDGNVKLASGERLRATAGPLAVDGGTSGVEKQLFDSNESSFDLLLAVDTSPSGALLVENGSSDEQGSLEVLPPQTLDGEHNPTDDQRYPEGAGIVFRSNSYMLAANSASLDEVSSLEKQGGVHRAKSAGRPWSEGRGEASVDEYFAGSAESIGAGQGYVIDSSQLEPEESTGRPLAEGGAEASVDEYLNGSAESIGTGQGYVIDSSQLKESTCRPLAEGRGEASVDEYFNGSAESIEVNQGHIIDSSQLDPEESTGKPLAAVGGEASVDEYFNGSAESIGTGQGHVMGNTQLEPEESTGTPLTGGGREASVDEYFNGSAESIEINQGHIIDGSQLDPEESTGKPLAAVGGEASVDEYFNGSAESIGTGQGRVIDNTQLDPEESLDELSSLEKQGETHRGNKEEEEGRESVDEYFNGSAVTNGVAQRRSSQLEAEESIEELASPENIGEEAPLVSSADDDQSVLLGCRVDQPAIKPVDNGSSRRVPDDGNGDLAARYDNPGHRQRQQPAAASDIGGAEDQLPRADGNEPSESAPAAPHAHAPVDRKEESLDEYLFDGGTSSYEDLLSLGGSSVDGGRSLGGGAVDGAESSSIEKHSLDQSFSGLSSSGGGSPLLSDGMSLGGSATSDVQLGGSSSEDVL